MDWNEIKEKYPKASEIFYQWQLGYEGWQRKFVQCFFDIRGGHRRLYDFFDSQEIYVNVSKEWYVNTDSIGFIFEDFFYEIISENYYYDCNPQIIIKTRLDAEEQAFLKAFEILERRLAEKA